MAILLVICYICISANYYLLFNISKRVLKAFTGFVKEKNAKTLNEAQDALSKKDA